MVAKARPAVIVSIPFHGDERALYALVPHTTALRGGRLEVPVSLRWLQPGAFDVQGLRNIPPSVLLRRLGALEPAQMEAVLQALETWLGIA
jgi:mRNA-degrading endonuclease toxin of MazEF toxin-antitoxin module